MLSFLNNNNNLKCLLPNSYVKTSLDIKICIKLLPQYSVLPIYFHLQVYPLHMYRHLLPEFMYTVLKRILSIAEIVIYAIV